MGEGRKGSRTGQWKMLSKDGVSVKSNLGLTPHGALGVNSPELISLEVSRPGSYPPAPISPCPPLENRG